VHLQRAIAPSPRRTVRPVAAVVRGLSVSHGVPK
jgi:hypothetical protein